jgi:hypothetical protein
MKPSMNQHKIIHSLTKIIHRPIYNHPKNKAKIIHKCTKKHP